MRLLHTSDWHLGRTLHRADLRPAQEAFVDALVETVRAESVDVVLIAGDVYDRAVPPLDAVTLFEDALLRLAGTGARVVVTSGNHDSPRRLGFGSRLVDHAGVHLRTRVRDLAEPLVLADGDGPVAVYALPYLEPDAVRGQLPGAPEPGEEHAGPTGRWTHEAVTAYAADRVREDAARRGLRRTVVVAHAWVAGGAGSDSEREIGVGGVGTVAPAVFGGFGYVALGHLHSPQAVRANIRYSGSPLAYSFSEAGQVKGSWLIDLGPSGVRSVTQVPAPVTRRLAQVSGDLEVLLTDGRFGDLADAFLAVRLTDRVRPEEPMRRLRTRFPHVLTLEWAPPEAAETTDGGYSARVRGRSDMEIASLFVEHVRRSAATPGERDLLAAALESARRGEARDPGGPPATDDATGVDPLAAALGTEPDACDDAVAAADAGGASAGATVEAA